jgi:hypothetical protein
VAGKTALFKKLCAEHRHASEFGSRNMPGSDLIALILAIVNHEEQFASSQKISAAQQQGAQFAAKGPFDVSSHLHEQGTAAVFRCGPQEAAVARTLK